MSITAAQIAEWLGLFCQPGACIELRAVKVRTKSYRRPHTVAGWYDRDHLLKMANDALELAPFATSVYMTMNPVDIDLHARRANRIEEAGEGELTEDVDVIGRRWILVDCDPVRKDGISSTDAEKYLARQLLLTIRRALSDEGWPAPIVADSGNGYHLLYPVDLPNDKPSMELVEANLKGLSAEFTVPGVVKVDSVVYNAARITKLYGTIARKGDDVPRRPHRVSKILVVPKRLQGMLWRPQQQ